MKSMRFIWSLIVSLVLISACATSSPGSATQLPNTTGTLLANPTLSSTVVATSTSTPLPAATFTLTPLDTLEPAQAMETLQPLLQDPMNCAVPCFWGIIPGKSQLDEVRSLFSRLGFPYKEGTDPNSGEYGLSVAYESSIGRDSSVSFYTFNNFIENIVVIQDIPQPTARSPRAWIAYSPETLIKQYGSPSRIEFTVGSGPNIGIHMIMYFDTTDLNSDLIIDYSGYNMNPNWFCPLAAPFDSVTLWMGYNPPDAPSYQTVPLEQATSLTMDKFTQLMLGDPKKACFALKGNVFQ